MLRILGLMILLMMSFEGSAAESIGRVILSLGGNNAYDHQGEIRAIKRNSLIYEKDLLVTGERGRLRVRFNDGSSISMKPDSALQMSKFQFHRGAPEQGQAVFQLMRGGLRTISGQIGKINPDNYRFQTVLATIGIRGTVYEVYVCDRCCAEKNNVAAGVAGGVEQGAIQVNTAVGDADLDSGLFFELSGEKSELLVTDERPAMLSVGDLLPYTKPNVPQPVESVSEPVVSECNDFTDLGEADTNIMRIWSLCSDHKGGGL